MVAKVRMEPYPPKVRMEPYPPKVQKVRMLFGKVRMLFGKRCV